MKFIFLDFDGVLNTPKTVQSLDRELVELLNELVCPEVRWVVSSTWRLTEGSDDLTNILQGYGFKGEVFDITPCLRKGENGKHICRGSEIHSWLDEHRHMLGCELHRFRDYVILDDDSDMLYCQRNNFINVDYTTGITPKTIYQIQGMLNLD